MNMKYAATEFTEVTEKSMVRTHILSFSVPSVSSVAKDINASEFSFSDFPRPSRPTPSAFRR